MSQSQENDRLKQIKFSIWHEAKKKAEKSIKTCFFPDCNCQSTNCHILQKNGILSKIIEENHLMQFQYNLFHNPSIYFERVGHNDAYSFNCFCNAHDSIFKPIECGLVDFTLYTNLLLFTIRTKLNEKYRKLVSIKQYEILIDSRNVVFNENDLKYFRNIIYGLKLGVQDIDLSLNEIWQDYFNNTESFVFMAKDIPKTPVVLSSFYTYETDYELDRWECFCGYPKPNVSDIFVCLLPYKVTSKLIFGFRKKNEATVGKYVLDMFSKEAIDLEILLTNLLFYACETWAISETFYNEKIKPKEAEFTANLKKPYIRTLRNVNILR
ncbi:MAG: hypothetical protein RBR97_01825 [Bacteroidales bacterium]|nr:hypothetical protein [Bacteroidales bacterium]